MLPHSSEHFFSVAKFDIWVPHSNVAHFATLEWGFIQVTPGAARRDGKN
jgi:hypothetical protein